jgi:hypothetical protein
MPSFEKDTLFIDIDGTILYHHGSIQDILTLPPRALPGAAEKLREWIRDGHMIILTTARDQDLYGITKEHLQQCGIPYHMLICGVTHGMRRIINDTKPYHASGGETAFGITVERNIGIRNIVL